MPAYRFYNPKKLTLNEEICIEGDENKHLFQVMRLQESDEIEIVDAHGGLAAAQIIKIDKRRSTAKVIDLEFHKQSHCLVLYQAMLKASKLELIIEKGTELGLSKLYLFMGEKSQYETSDKKLNRFYSIALAALKQSGRLYMPQIHIIEPIIHWKEFELPCFFGDVSSSAPPIGQELNRLTKEKEICFICGPESGFSAQEHQKLLSLKSVGVSLNNNTLKAETAPLAFCSLAAQHFLIQSNGSIIN